MQNKAQHRHPDAAMHSKTEGFKFNHEPFFLHSLHVQSLNEKCSRRLPSSSSSRGPSRTGHAELGKKKSINHSQPSRRRRRSKMHFSQLALPSPTSTKSSSPCVSTSHRVWWREEVITLSGANLLTYPLRCTAAPEHTAYSG